MGQQSVRKVGLDDGREVTIVEGGFLGFERIVPPAGEDYAFTRAVWRKRVEVYTSRTGRSVRVFIDGNEIR